MLISLISLGEKSLVLNHNAIADTAINLYGVNDITITGLAFQTSYDAATGLGDYSNGIRVNTDSIDLLIYRNSFSGSYHGILYRSNSYAWPNPTRYYMFAVDNKFTNWMNYGIMGPIGSWSAVLGNSIRQNPNAVSGEDSKCDPCSPNLPNHGPIRISRGIRILISNNDLESLNGWSSGGLGNQPNVRMASSGSAGTEDGLLGYSVVSDNIMRGSSMGVSGPPNTANNARAEHIIWERNLNIAGEYGDVGLSHGGGGQYVRNNVFVKPANGQRRETIMWQGSGTYKRAINFAAGGSLPFNNLDSPNYIYGNTLISLEPLADRGKLLYVSTGAATNITFKNNVAYLPYADGSISHPTLIGALVEWVNGNPDGLESDNNLMYAPLSPNRFASIGSTDYSLTEWQALGFGGNSMLADPQFVKIPDHCASSALRTGSVTDATTETVPDQNTFRTRITHATTDFEALGAYPSRRIKITFSSGGPGSLDCDVSGGADADYNKCKAETIVYNSGNTITLESDILFSGTPTLDFIYLYEPSTQSRIYVPDNSQFSPGDLITYNREHEFNENIFVRNIAAVGNDPVHGDYIDLDSPLPERARGYVCEWPLGTTDFNWDLSLQSTSPAIDVGAVVPVYDDFDGNLRDASSDIGAFEFIDEEPQVVCGNGIIEDGETCDDGNTVDGDGCSSSCQIENQPPSVDAGVDQTITLPTNTVVLDGTVTDDGLPLPTNLTTAWAVQSGPAAVTFGDSAAVDTNATFTQDGIYVLELSANDTEYIASSFITITVNPPPPCLRGRQR